MSKKKTVRDLCRKYDDLCYLEYCSVQADYPPNLLRDMASVRRQLRDLVGNKVAAILIEHISQNGFDEPAEIRFNRGA